MGWVRWPRLPDPAPDLDGHERRGPIPRPAWLRGADAGMPTGVRRPAGPRAGHHTGTIRLPEQQEVTDTGPAVRHDGALAPRAAVAECDNGGSAHPDGVARRSRRQRLRAAAA